MTVSRSKVLEIHDFANELQDSWTPLTEYRKDHHYEQNLRKTVEELKVKLAAERDHLSRLRAHGNVPVQVFDAPVEDAPSRLRQLKLIHAAYGRLSAIAPDLPEHGSSLPQLLALRSTGKLVSQTRAAAPMLRGKADSIRLLLATERSRLHAYRQLGSGLEERIRHMQHELDQTSSMTQYEVLELHEQRDVIAGNDYKNEENRLRRELIRFIDWRLAPMLAAEEVGGPNVGNDPKISDELLGSGFGAKGQTISLPVASLKEGGFVEKGAQLRKKAGRKMKQLLKDLLISYENDPQAFFQIEAESAASRFAVHAKIAELDPEDACRLRLIDFGQGNDRLLADHDEPA